VAAFRLIQHRAYSVLSSRVSSAAPILDTVPRRDLAHNRDAPLLGPPVRAREGRCGMAELCGAETPCRRILVDPQERMGMIFYPCPRAFGRQRRSSTAQTWHLLGREEPWIPQNTMTRRKAEMQSYTWSSKAAVLIAALLLPLFCSLAHAQELEGTWKLVMRKLSDGTTQVPPAIRGAATGHNGRKNLIE